MRTTSSAGAAPELIEGGAGARFPQVVIDDFNLDGKPDLAVFDLGHYVWS